MTRRDETSVEAAAKLNHSLRIDGITVAAVEAKLLRQVEEPRWTFHLLMNEVHWGHVSEQVVALYSVEVLVQHTVDEEKRENLGLLRVATRAAYSVVEPLDDEQEACVPDFLGIVGWMQAWPYLRAEIQELSTKLGFPPLTLPLLLSGQTSKVAVVGGDKTSAEEAAEVTGNQPSGPGVQHPS